MRFNINAPFWRFMDTLLRFVGLNLVYLITLIPNVTIGPARAALYSTMFAYDEHDDIRLVKEYLTRFKREFKQGLAAWVLVVIDVLAAGLSYFVPFIRVLAILFGIAWVAYAKSLILLWGFKRYGGTGKVENPQYVNAHE
jgi:uncharacterized membrane protein YesL